MKRYYLSKIFVDETGPFPVWKHALQNHQNIDYQGGEIKTDLVTGIPTEKALLVLVAAKNHKPFKDDLKMLEIPAGRDGLNIKIGAIDTVTKLAFRAGAKVMGFDHLEVETITDNINSWKQVVNFYGKKNNAAFDADNFDLGED